MDYGLLLKALPGESKKYKWIYIVDLGNGNSEVGVTSNLRGTVHRYLTTEDPIPVSFWHSKPFPVEPKPADSRLAMFDVGLEDWNWGFVQLLEFCNRAAVNKIGETRFLILPASVVKAWAMYCKLGPGREHIFFTGEKR
ncbi:hypothetical protein [Micromonospora tulbaghiae]|uniref:hypothetical protein n=1 Tax=Micromonospora tulbaghiae TaxID=479978 RepID=UPI0013C47470|nr:hypothetical protein [Micromonospora tulbaghiae]